jgi:hypothetical protein
MDKLVLIVIALAVIGFPKETLGASAKVVNYVDSNFGSYLSYQG